MFAVIKTGGKQYKVAEGDQIVIEKLESEAGNDVTFDSVLMLGGEGEYPYPNAQQMYLRGARFTPAP